MTLNKKTISLIALIMVVGSAGMTYAATSFFGEDCSVYASESGASKTCYDLNYLNERVHDLTNRVVALEAIHEPEPEPTELTIEVKPTSILAGENFTASGVVPYVEGNDLVAIHLFSPNGTEIENTKLTDVVQESSYLIDIFTNGPDWSVSGNYTVQAFYDEQYAEALLEYITP